MDVLNKAVTAYIECALWAGLDYSRETGGNNPPLDANYSPEDVLPETREFIESEVKAFYEANSADLETLDPEQVGHDFYLTRNRHGAGFWDRGLGELGDRLTKAAHAYGEFDLYPGSDGKLYHNVWVQPADN